MSTTSGRSLFKHPGAQPDEDRYDVVLHANGESHRELAVILFLILSAGT